VALSFKQDEEERQDN